MVSRTSFTLGDKPLGRKSKADGRRSVELPRDRVLSPGPTPDTRPAVSPWTSTTDIHRFATQPTSTRPDHFPTTLHQNTWPFLQTPQQQSRPTLDPQRFDNMDMTPTAATATAIARPRVIRRRPSFILPQDPLRTHPPDILLPALLGQPVGDGSPRGFRDARGSRRTVRVGVQ